jgi:hypothetical protein
MVFGKNDQNKIIVKLLIPGSTFKGYSLHRHFIKETLLEIQDNINGDGKLQTGQMACLPFTKISYFYLNPFLGWK